MFAYYGKPILWFVVGLANARALTNTETQEFLFTLLPVLHHGFSPWCFRREWSSDWKKADNLRTG